MPNPLAPTRRRRGRHRRRSAPLPLVRAAFGAIVLAVAVGGVPAAGPAGIVPGSVPAVAQPHARPPAQPSDRSAEVAGVAVQAALAQLGLPYEWGGDGPAAGDTGFDCSGLTRHAYAAAGVALPRTAHTQFYAGPGVPAPAPLQPGDLVFYGTLERVHHVGLYLGDGTMVNAPSRGRPVQVSRHRYPGDAYLGATRPAALGDPALVPPRPAPAPAPIPLPEVFDAPAAPLPDGLRDDVRAAPRQPDAVAGPADVVTAAGSRLAGPSSRPGDRSPRGPAAPLVLDGPADRPAPDLPARDLPARDLPARDLSARDRPARDRPATDLPTPGLPTGTWPTGTWPTGTWPTGGGPVVGPRAAGPAVGTGARPIPATPPVPADRPAPVAPSVPTDPAVPALPLGPGAPLPPAGPAAPLPPAGPVAPADPAGRPGPVAPALVPGGTTARGTLVATRDRHVVVPAVDPGPDGLPPVTGRVGSLLRVPPELLDGLVVGDPVELTTADVTDDLTVVSRTVVPAAEVAAVTAPALAAPGPDGRWTLVVLG